jgi:hypothetical protein
MKDRSGTRISVGIGMPEHLVKLQKVVFLGCALFRGRNQNLCSSSFNIVFSCLLLSPIIFSLNIFNLVYIMTKPALSDHISFYWLINNVVSHPFT